MRRLFQHTALCHAIPVKTPHTPNRSPCSDSPHNADYLSAGLRLAPQHAGLCLRTWIAPFPTDRSSTRRVGRQSRYPLRGLYEARHPHTRSSQHLHFSIPRLVPQQTETRGRPQPHTIPRQALHSSEPASGCGLRPRSSEWPPGAPPCPTVRSGTRTARSSPGGSHISSQCKGPGHLQLSPHSPPKDMRGPSNSETTQSHRLVPRSANTLRNAQRRCLHDPRSHRNSQRQLTAHRPSPQTCPPTHRLAP